MKSECVPHFSPFNNFMPLNGPPFPIIESKKKALCISHAFFLSEAFYYMSGNSNFCDLQSCLAVPRQDRKRKPRPTNWSPLGLIQTHVHQRWLVLAVYKRAPCPAKLRE